ncbi:hypothetical protein [Burkholderia sp. 22PA0106]|uniref:hypothetical protein n=1 Tax=Burkholderia sp. 22PA0106 TaxID=3237371 RepID=UPI0039C36727
MIEVKAVRLLQAADVAISGTGEQVRPMPGIANASLPKIGTCHCRIFKNDAFLFYRPRFMQITSPPSLASRSI